MHRRRTGGLLVLAVLAGGIGCSAEPAEHTGTDAASTAVTLSDDTVTVGSFDFAESELLAELYSQVLEAGGYDVQRRFRLGPRELVLPALSRGLVEVVPEYAGSALEFASITGAVEAAGAEATNDALAEALDDQQITVLPPSPAEDANTFVVTRATAGRNDLERLSDLARIAPDLTFAGSPECASRPFCLVGLDRVYGVSFREVLPLDAGGPLTHQALDDGNVDIALLFTTDPALIGGRFVELEDDRDLQPSENVTPLVRSELVERFGPDLVDRLDAISQRLSTERLRALNARVDDGNAIATVASEWLAQEGLT